MHTFEYRGRTFRVQGYERFAIPAIIKANNLRVSQVYEAKYPDKIKRPPTIYYTMPGERKVRRHYPDLWIPHLNTIVEIKSMLTAGLIDSIGHKQNKRTQKMILAKKKAAEAAGFKYVILVVNPGNAQSPTDPRVTCSRPFG